MTKKTFALWYRGYRDEEVLCIPNEEIKELIPLYDDYVVKFPGLAVTPENRAMLESLLPKINEEGTPEYLDELEGVEMKLAADVEEPAEVLCYFRASESIGTLDECETCRVYEYWDGSNWRYLWLEDEWAEDIVTVDAENSESLDTWDGSNMNFRTKFNHGKLYPIIEHDGEPANGKYLLVTWTDYQDDIATGEIVDESKAQQLRIEAGIVEPEVLTQCTIEGLRFAVIVIDEEAKTAAEAIWTDGSWDTDFSHHFLPVTAEEVAEAMDYDFVREAGYTIID